MDRREALKQTAILMGGAITASTWTAMVTGCERPGKITSFSEENTVNLLSEVAETIIPETDTPGAKAAGVGPFIAMMLQECYEEKRSEEDTSEIPSLMSISYAVYCFKKKK